MFESMYFWVCFYSTLTVEIKTRSKFGFQSGFLSSLPYIGSFFFAIAYGVLSDYFVNRGYVTLKTTRIVCNTLGQ